MQIIKKYSNRKIYGEIDGKKGYLDLTDIANLVRQGKEFSIVKHNKGKPDHGQDVTTSVLKEVLTRLVVPDTILKEMIQRYLTKE